MATIPRQTPTRTAASITRTQKAVKASAKPGGAASPNVVKTGSSKTIVGKRGPGPSIAKPATKPGGSAPKPGLKHPGGSPIVSKVPRPQKAAPTPINGGDIAKQTVVGGVKLGTTHVKNNMAVPVLLFVSFLIVGLAKVRGLAVLDVPKAFFGGFVLTLILLLVNMWSSQIAIGFAALVLVQVLLEYGPAAFKGVFSGHTTLPTSSLPVVSGINQNVPTGLEGAIGGDINSHPDSLPAGQGSLSDAFGRK